MFLSTIHYRLVTETKFSSGKCLKFILGHNVNLYIIKYYNIHYIQLKYFGVL